MEEKTFNASKFWDSDGKLAALIGYYGEIDSRSRSILEEKSIRTILEIGNTKALDDVFKDFSTSILSKEIFLEKSGWIRNMILNAERVLAKERTTLARPPELDEFLAG